MGTISFKDPADGIERVFSFQFQPEFSVLGDYVHYRVTSVRPNPGSPRSRWYFSEDNLIAAMASVRPGFSSAQFSEIVTADLGSSEQKYSVRFTENFMKGALGFPEITPIGPERDPQAVPPVRDYETPLGIQVYEEFSFKFPKTRRVALAPQSIDFRTTTSQEAAILEASQDKLAQDLIEIDPAAEDYLFTTFSASQRGGDVNVWFPLEFIGPLGAAQAAAQSAEALAGQSVEVEEQDGLQPFDPREIPETDLTLNEQAILLFRLGQLMTENKSLRTNPKTSTYDRFVCLDYRTPSNASDVPNHITSAGNLAPLFDELKPIHLSAMIPKIRVFKEYAPKDKKVQDGKPGEIVELEFEEFAESSVLNKALTTNTGVGIDSFEWSFNGENSFTAERLVNATMKLRVQNIDALEKERRNSQGKTYKFSDIVLPPSIRKQVDDKKNPKQSAVPSAEHMSSASWLSTAF